MLSVVVFCRLCVPAAAHQPDGVLHKAFRLPDDAVLTIDGDLADWALFGTEYALTTTDFTDLVRGAAPDPADFSVWMQIAWSSSTNSLYLGARVFDDIHQVDRPAGSAATHIFQDDDLEVFLDADHSGGQFADFADLDPDAALLRNGAQASHFVLAWPPPDDVFFVNFSAAGWYALSDGPYTEAACQYDSEIGMVTYELRIVPFDHVDVHAVFRSDEHVLRAGDVLGFNVEFNDFDAHPTLYEAKWSLSGAHNSFRFADRFSDLMLVSDEGIFPTVSRAASWGQVKAAFRYGAEGAAEMAQP